MFGTQVSAREILGRNKLQVFTEATSVQYAKCCGMEVNPGSVAEPWDPTVFSLLPDRAKMLLWFRSVAYFLVTVTNTLTS